MLVAMFGMGMSEILVILLVAALFLGPEKLPDAATKISKGIRDLRKQTRELTDTIENDTEIGGAIRDLKSALRGDELRRPPVRKPPPAQAAVAAAIEASATEALPAGEAASAPVDPVLATDASDSPAAEAASSLPASLAAPAVLSVPATVTLAPTAGQSDADAGAADDDEDEHVALARLIRPAAGSIKRDDPGTT